MKKKFCLTYWVYTPVFVLYALIVAYLFGVSLIATRRPGSDCSFVPLFVALGIVFAVSAAVMLLNVIFKWLFRKTGKRVCLVPCILVDIITCAANSMIGIDLFADGAPAPMRGVFLALALAAAACMIANFVGLFKKV